MLVTISIFVTKNKIKEKRTDETLRLEDEISKTDKKIDELVYQLYKLTKEEIAIIENSLES